MTWLRMALSGFAFLILTLNAGAFDLGLSVNLGLTAMTVSAAQEVPKATIKELLKERHALLTEVVSIVMMQYKAGNVDLKSIMIAERLALQAGLEAAESSAQRIDVLKSEMKIVESILKVTEAMFKGGQRPKVDVLQVRAMVLDVRILLMREEEKGQQRK